MLYSGTDPESYITEYTLVYEDQNGRSPKSGARQLPCKGTFRSHMQTHIIYKLGFNQNYYTFTLILLIKIVVCSKFPWHLSRYQITSHPEWNQAFKSTADFWASTADVSDISSRFESLILSHHSRLKVTCECNAEEINDDVNDVQTSNHITSIKSRYKLGFNFASSFSVPRKMPNVERTMSCVAPGHSHSSSKGVPRA